MPQINLLKQNSSSADLTWMSTAGSIAAKVLIVVVLVLLGYYGWLYIQSGSKSKEVVKVSSEVEAQKASILQNPEKEEIVARQAQLKEQETLINNHVYWSRLFPVIACSSLKDAEYSSMDLTNDGVITLSLTVPDIRDLEKFLQVFDLSDYNKYFSDVRISSISKSQGTDKALKIKVDTKLKFDTSILKYDTKPVPIKCTTPAL